MYLPAFTTQNAPQRNRTIDFRGYNDGPVIQDGEMREMENLSSEKYPHLYQRNLRNTYSEMFQHPIAIFPRRGSLAVVDIQELRDDEENVSEVGVFYYGTVEEDGVLRPKKYPGLTLSTEEKVIAAVNTRIIIFPDKKWFNTETKLYGSLDCVVESGDDDVTFTDSQIEFSGVGHPFGGFNIGDAVSITGSTNNNVTAIIKGSSVTAHPDNHPVLMFADNTFTPGAESNEITISRVCPEMDFIMESNNRLWGCKGSTIYASKLGDPLNWNSFQGLSDDSYAVDVGTDGDFTGCIPYASHLLFFKENYIHKLYGNKPASYTMVTAECYALETGSHRSIEVINEVVFYKSRLGIMAYTGDTPELISSNFGTRRYGITVAGSDGIKYYASMKYGDTYDLMVFDLDKSLWHKEDHTQARDFAFINNELIFIDASTEKLLSINPETADESDQIQWSAELGDFDELIEDKKIYSKIKMKFNLHQGSDITISVKPDNTEWIQIAHIYAETERAVFIPIIPQRCEKFKIRIEGRGFCEIESLVRDYTIGSER